MTVLAAEGTFAFAVPDPLDPAAMAPAADDARSPMPGLVRAVPVAPGAAVAPGGRLAVVEAMRTGR